MILDQREIRRIGVFRALQLGDMLCAIPAIRNLRMAYPQAEITLIGLPWAESFASRFDKYFDSFISFPGYPGLPEQDFCETRYSKFVHAVRRDPFDVVIQMQGNGSIVNQMIVEWAPKFITGFCQGPSSRLFLRYPSGIHEIHRHLRLMQFLGIPANDDGLEFIERPGDVSEFLSLELDLHKRDYVCVHPGSRGRWRQWPPELFARAADLCAEAGFKIVVTGTASEAGITSAVVNKMDHPAIDLTASTSLGAMAILLRNAKLLISNCTGVSHISAATKTASIVISMDGEPERWGPLDSSLHSTIDCRNNDRFADVAGEIGRRLFIPSIV